MRDVSGFGSWSGSGHASWLLQAPYWAALDPVALRRSILLRPHQPRTSDRQRSTIYTLPLGSSFRRPFPVHGPLPRSRAARLACRRGFRSRAWGSTRKPASRMRGWESRDLRLSFTRGGSGPKEDGTCTIPIRGWRMNENSANQVVERTCRQSCRFGLTRVGAPIGLGLETSLRQFAHHPRYVLQKQWRILGRFLFSWLCHRWVVAYYPFSCSQWTLPGSRPTGTAPSCFCWLHRYCRRSWYGLSYCLPVRPGTLLIHLRSAAWLAAWSRCRRFPSPSSAGALFWDR